MYLHKKHTTAPPSFGPGGVGPEWAHAPASSPVAKENETSTTKPDRIVPAPRAVELTSGAVPGKLRGTRLWCLRARAETLEFEAL